MRKATPKEQAGARRDQWCFVALVGLVLLAYSPALGGGFLWDDDGHVTRPELRSVAGLARIWFEPGASQQYYPVLHSLFWVEHRLWGDAAFGYHLVNILLHATVACLLVAVLRRLFAPGSLQGIPAAAVGSSAPEAPGAPAWWAAPLAGALFALHPVMVESVAWISEQKNTLSGAFYLAAALAYFRFDGLRHHPAGGSARTAYFLATGLFALALLSKTVTASLPAALLLAIWWRRGRLDWRRDVVPLLPWFAMGVTAGLFTAWVEREFIGAQGWEYDLSFVQRLLLAGRICWFYLGKLLWPFGLSFNYERWTLELSDALLWLSLAAIVALLATLWVRRNRWRGALVAALYFGGTLFPALGFFDVYPFRYSYVADHFQYLASIGPIALLAFALTRRPALASLGVFVAAAMGVLTARQSHIYADSDRLWQETLAQNPKSWLAHDAVAQSLLARGDAAGAIAHLEEALALNPQPPQANNLGLALQKAGRIEEAIVQMERAVEALPSYVEGRSNLGAAYAQAGRLADAVAQLRAAVQLKPQVTKIRHNLGLALRSSGDLSGALAQFEQILAQDPRNPEALNALGITLLRAERVGEAIPVLERAVAARPEFLSALENLGSAYLQAGRPADAVPVLEEALRLEPARVGNALNLGQALLGAGRVEDAIQRLRENISRNPQAAELHLVLARALERAGRPQESAAAKARADDLRRR